MKTPFQIRIHFQPKDEANRIEEKSEDIAAAVAVADVDRQYEITKEETRVSIEDSSDFSPDVMNEHEFHLHKDLSDYDRINCERELSDCLLTTPGKTKAERKHIPEKQEIVDPAKNYQCEYCNKICAQKCSLILHMKTHCRSMDIMRRKTKPVRSSKTFKQSLNDQTVDKQKCPFCHRIYKRKHECRLIEPKVPNVFSCTHCPETFSTYPKIYHHHKTQHPDKPKPLSPFQCDICGAFALRLYALKRHMLVHTDYAPFACEICQKRFRTRQKLTEHQRKHIPKSERDDKYKCNICQKKFTFRQSLKKHERLQHTNNRKLFPCNICGGKFISETSLQKHQTTHEGEAPRNHKCDQCGRIFEKLKYFNHHRKIRHNIFTDLMLNPKPKKKK
ncbi:zinc finger and SCAN domain-containing protein 12-like [Phlebotomus argentipes]|uniref:zinc finger and SCAN domain-containing protein 12-like n=1 Tax=Phlebotomus argentipes TaxID=94469 RepID=UPI002892F7D0|nr:zinc finger and SCAN domain-containing protein 12-like [Phlebotomus argentipes]